MQICHYVIMYSLYDRRQGYQTEICADTRTRVTWSAGSVPDDAHVQVQLIPTP